MDSNINKDSGAGEGKGKQNVLLVVLLVLVAVFAYVYFFTGLIKPEKPAEAPQVAKKPLPPSDGAPAKPEAADAAKKDAAPPAAKPEAAPAAPAAPAPVAAAKQPEQSQPAEAVKKPLPGADKAGAKKPAAPEKKEPAAAPAPPAPKPAAAPAPAPAPKPVAVPAPAPKPAEVKKPAEKPAPAPAVAKAKPEVRKPVRKEKAEPARITGSGPWTVVVGNYVLEEELAENLARVKRAGYEASVVPGGNRKNSMSRLLLAEFTDRESAQAELAKLKKHTADAFMADQGGMHIVYAGSYLLESRATAEMERLAAAGFKLTMKRVEVSLPTKNLTAGPFAEKSAAEEALKKLRPAESKSGGAR